MTYIPGQPVMLQMTDWAKFKTVVLVQKGLELNYCDFPDYYDIRAADTERYWIILPKGTPEAQDFEDNYKSSANARYDTRVVLVTVAGDPTIDELGADAPAGATMMAGIDTDGKLRSFKVDAATGRLLLMPVAFSSYATTEGSVDDPPPAPQPPASGGPWYWLGSDCIEEKKTIYWYWGAL
jgi:hypothetical protein